MQFSLKAIAATVGLLCVSLALLSTAGNVAQWLAPTLLLVSALLAICVAAGAAGRARAFAVAYLGTVLVLVLLPWQERPYSLWKNDVEDYTLVPMHDLWHDTQGRESPYLHMSVVGLRVYVPSSDKRQILSPREAEAAGINVDALPRIPSRAEFRPVFYSIAFVWLGLLAGGLATYLHHRSHSSSSPPPPSPSP